MMVPFLSNTFKIFAALNQEVGASPCAKSSLLDGENYSTPSVIRKNSSSVITLTPNCWALSNLLPAPGPATT